MGHPGSGTTRPPATPPSGSSPSLVAAFAVTGLGVLAMFQGTALLAPARLGLRPQIALGTALLALPAVLLLLAHRPTRAAALGSAQPTLRVLSLAALLGAALWAASIGLMEMQELVFPVPASYIEGFRAIHRALAPRGPFDALVSLAVIAILPGICEELVLRGMLLPALVRPLTPAGAVVGSAALFAAIHDDRYRFLFTLSIGLVLGLLRLRSASLWPSVTAHAVLNALTFAIAPLLDDPSQPETPEPLLGLVCLVIGTAVAVPLLRRLDLGRGSGRRSVG
jgi:membrane protease YdiL (CAAX protease family)